MENSSASALEQFRKQWRDEVNARKGNIWKPKSTTASTSSSNPKSQTPERLVGQHPTRHPLADVRDEEHRHDEDSDSSLIKNIEGLAVRNVDDDDFSTKPSASEPQSALDHFERAVEKESLGNLGDSLSLYRKAYRLDAKVDQSYRNKHFPAKSKASDANPSNASATVPNPAHHSSKEPLAILTTPELIESFSDLSIPGADPVIEGDIPPPCPIATLAQEVLLELLLQTAILDPASFTRLSLVCKKLAYHVYNETLIWKRIALGPEFGLASQVWNFNTDIQGRELIERPLDSSYRKHGIDDFSFSQNEDWRNVFHAHPRVRFTGIYISTVNYTRAGHGAGIATWNSPVHIVTYYRYLRFFRDGTVISLLSTSEPADVVHHLTPENVKLARSPEKGIPHPLNFTSSAPAVTVSGKEANSNPAPPSAQHLLRHALRGRWRMCHLSSPTSTPSTSLSEIATNGAGSDGDIHIETEGAGPRYMYTLYLALKSGSRAKHAVKNNKLQWKGFWSYNSLTNDWAEFQLRNDKAFYFSRVKSYGLGY